MIPPAPRCQDVPACPVCGSPRARPKFVSPDLLLAVPGAWGYLECRECGTVYQSPRVCDVDLPLCYPAGYYTHHAPDWTAALHPGHGFRNELKRAVRHVVDGASGEGLSILERTLGHVIALHPILRRRARFGLSDVLVPPPRCGARSLEVGPGHGFDLWCLRQLGWEAHGLDVDPVAARNAEEHSGCEVRVGMLATTDYPRGHFDLVYMNHVAEHLPDLASALRACRGLLVPGGRLIVVWPNPEALTARIHGHLSIVWDPPRHLVLPPSRAMRSLLERAGFVDVRTRTSAWRGAVNSAAARQLAARREPGPVHLDPPRTTDWLFALVESLLTFLLPIGEEIVALARAPETPAGDPV